MLSRREEQHKQVCIRVEVLQQNMRKRTKRAERWSDEEHDQEQKEEHKVREQRVFLNCAYPETFFFCCPSATLALFSPRRLKLEILRTLKAKGGGAFQQ